jgi:hypothetical protein
MDSSSYFTFRENTIENLNNFSASDAEKITKLKLDYSAFMASNPDMSSEQMGSEYYTETLQQLKSEV